MPRDVPTDLVSSDPGEVRGRVFGTDVHLSEFELADLECLDSQVFV